MGSRLWRLFADLWEDDPDPSARVYDPVHVAGVFVGCLFLLGVMYWTLWSLFVFEGGLFTKVIPLLKVIFTSKTLLDYGYQGSPYALGLFEGWMVNLAGLVITLGFIGGLWAVFRRLEAAGPPHRRQK